MKQAIKRIFITGCLLLFSVISVNAESDVFSGTENTVVITMDDADVTLMNEAEMGDKTVYSASIVINGTTYDSVGIRLSTLEDMPDMDKGKAPERGMDDAQGKPLAGGTDERPEPPTGNHADQDKQKGEPPSNGVEPKKSYLIQMDSTVSEQNYEGLTSFILNPVMELSDDMEKPAEMHSFAEATVTLNDSSLGSYSIME